jgi:hypothetical protein
MELNKWQNQLYDDIIRLIEEARNFVANTSNATITLLYWKIGNCINSDLLDNQRAEYGKQIVSLLATQLQVQYGKRGFQERNIRRMMQFAELFPDFQIVSEVATKLSWSHFIELIAVKEPLILCAEGGQEQIELLQLENAGIKVAEYLNELPDRELLKQKIHRELEIKRQLFENRKEGENE